MVWIATVHFATASAATPAQPGAKVPDDLTWDLVVGETRTGVRQVQVGTASVEERLTTVRDALVRFEWRATGPHADALRTFRPIGREKEVCPGMDAKVWVGVTDTWIEVRLDDGVRIVVVVMPREGSACEAITP